MSANKPLSDLRILDLTQAASGPMCAAHFVALGAEVLKIEVPGVGDSARRAGPYLGAKGIGPMDRDETDMAICFLKRNRGKKGLTLNLKSPKGLEIFYRLVAISDVVLDNYRPGVTERLGITHERLQKIKKDIICCSITGFGHTGPYRTRAAYDTVVQAMSGVMEMTGFADGPPVRAGFLAGDGVAPLFATSAILAAIRQRDKTGEGQFIDVSMLDCLASMVWDAPMDYIASNARTARVGNQMALVPANAYECKDGTVVIMAGQQHQWARLTALMGREELTKDPRFATLDDRMANVLEVDRLVNEWTGTLTKEQAVRACEAVGLACGPVNTIPELLSDPHLKSRGLVDPLSHPLMASTSVATAAGYPVKFGKFQASFDDPAPTQGQHTAEVLSGLLKLTASELAQLAEEKVI